MGFPFLFLSRLIVRSPRNKEPRPRAATVAVESLERRVLFDVQINSPVFDAPGSTNSKPQVALADQAETTNVTFSPPGSNDRTVVAYNDSAMAQFGQVSGLPMHRTGWAYSDNGGSSFVQPNNSPANPVLLPTVSDGTEITGDEANHSLAWDNVNATLYLADTSWPNHSDINVYASTDGGHTFTQVMDATPGAPTGSSNTITYDKPWVAVDNNPDSPNYGTVYLAYVQNINNSQNQIFITYLAPGSRSWPTFSNQFSLATGLVQSPEVLVEPGGSVDVVYVGPDSTGLGIFLEHSGSPTRQQGWTAAPTPLVHYNDVLPSSWSVDPYSVGPNSTYPTIAGILVYPSTAIIKIGTDTYLYGAYTDATQVGEGPDVTLGVYTFQYDLTQQEFVGSPNSPIGAVSTETDEWQPSLAFSPDGAYAFIGFYGGTGVYNQDAITSDEQYNVFYVAAQVRADGINWSAPTQITNVDSFGQPTGGYFDQPGGPLQNVGVTLTPPGIWSPDYDGASSDYQNFHYSFMETSGASSPIPYEEDVYMANIPIPYTGDPAPPVPTQVAAARGTFDGESTLEITWDHTQTHYDDDDDEAYVEYSAAGQGWQPLGTYTLAANGSIKFFEVDGEFIPNYSVNTTYYFRVRAQEGSGPGHATSAWSAVLVAPGSNTMLFTGTGASDTIKLKMDSSGNSIDFTLNNVQTTVPIISGGSILVLGAGGDDTITFDLSNGNFLAADTEIDNDGGSMSLEIVGTTANNTVNVVGGGRSPYQFDGTYVNVVAGPLNSLEYDDGGGNDTISVSGSVPTTVNLSSGDGTINVSGALPVLVNLSTGNNTVTNSDSLPVYIVPSAGKIALSATAGATVFPASTGTGIRQIDFAALNISSGAYVYFASSAALGDYSNHANRSVAVIDAGGLNVATGGTLDMGDNDMILDYAPANRAATGAMVFDLLASGITGNGDWSGTGITSGEASYDSDFSIGARAVGFMDNNDVQDTSFDGVSLSDFNQIVVKFTYYGDVDLTGTFDATDVNQLIAGRSHTPGNTGWEFCDLDYDGTTSTAQDQNLFFAGRDAYQQFGTL